MIPKKRERDENVPLDRLVVKHREVLIEQKHAEIPTLYANLEELERRRATCTGRAMLRLARDLERAVCKTRERVRYLEADEHLKEFDANVVPYVEAYMRQSGVPKRKAAHVVVPGDTRPRFEIEENVQSQSCVVDAYLTDVQGEVPRARIERADMCPRCADSRMLLVVNKAVLACPQCGLASTYLDATSSSISYDDSVEMVTFSYKRGNHFQDWLTNVQGKEAHEVPQEVIDAVMMELYRQRVTDVEAITTQRVREILKTMRLRKCYEHCAQIVSRITGRPPPRLPPEAAELCRLMFTAVIGPFQKHCPPERKNMLSYSFVLSKFLYILGYDDLCNTLTMLKGKDKIAKMDVVWRKICEDLDWETF